MACPLARKVIWWKGCRSKWTEIRGSPRTYPSLSVRMSTAGSPKGACRQLDAVPTMAHRFTGVSGVVGVSSAICLLHVEREHGARARALQVDPLGIGRARHFQGYDLRPDRREIRTRHRTVRGPPEAVQH